MQHIGDAIIAIDQHDIAGPHRLDRDVAAGVAVDEARRRRGEAQQALDGGAGAAARPRLEQPAGQGVRRRGRQLRLEPGNVVLECRSLHPTDPTVRRVTASGSVVWSGCVAFVKVVHGTDAGG